MNIRRGHCHFLILSLLFVNAVQARDGNALTMCIDHYPPLQMVLPGGEATGENVELTRAFAQRLGYQLKFTADTPFKRCLQWLKDGLVDVMAGLLHSPQRHLDYHMFLYDDSTVKQFFVRKNHLKITRFSDLEGLVIGVVRGSRQFELFDNAPEGMFTKVYVNTLTAAFGMLEKERVDAVVCTDYYGHNVINSHPEYKAKIIPAAYTVIDGTRVYIGLSRKSPFASELSRFQTLAEEMHQTGEFTELMRQFQIQHPEYY
ncbi:MAG: substrate-binding periplasmic protein [Aestuariibacter sp.]